MMNNNVEIYDAKNAPKVDETLLNEFLSEKIVAVAGDWHANSAFALHMVDVVHSKGIKTILHAGDFGIWGGDFGNVYLRKLNNRLRKYDMMIFVTLGNHENYDMVGRMTPVVSGSDKFKNVVSRPDIDRIVILPRGFVWEVNGHRFMSFGGASSIDRDSRTVGKDWWAGEQITDADVIAGREAGKVDVMITHDVPAGYELFKTQSVLPRHIQVYAQESRDQLKKVFDVARPALAFHGHYHRYQVKDVIFRVNGEYEFYETKSVILNKDNDPDNLVALNTETLRFEKISY